MAGLRVGSPGFGVAVLAALAIGGCAATSSSATASATTPVPGSVSPPEWAELQADLAAADAARDTAEDEGWWAGPVCSPDIELHREQAGQSPLSDEQMRADCAATLGEFRSSEADYDRLQALDGSARAAEVARIGTVLGLPAGQPPTIAQVVVVHGCEQGWITDPADCAGIPTGR